MSNPDTKMTWADYVQKAERYEAAETELAEAKAEIERLRQAIRDLLKLITHPNQ